MSIQNLLVKKIIDSCGDQDILTIQHIIKSKICSSPSVAKTLLRDAKIPTVKLGRREVFSKDDLLGYLRAGLTEYNVQ